MTGCTEAVSLPSGESLLAIDGDAVLYRDFLPVECADRLLDELLSSVHWREERLFLFGRWVSSPRRVVWHGDAGADYRYSGVLHRPLPWTPSLQALRQSLNQTFGCEFNSVLLNLYRDGADSMGWHSDDERELGAQPQIASLSLGAQRRFRFRYRNDRSRSVGVDLAHGSLLLMRGSTQRCWQHALPKTRRVVGPRVNLTFRTIRTHLRHP